MEEKTVIFDISSDEEPAFEVAEGDDLSWLTKLLYDDVEDSDEVVVVGETKSKSAKPTANSDDEDDCIVLDGDPDKPVAVDEDQEAEGDDLVVVGQKGQIACRDYPHPRHLCAKFPFSSTAHETHCELCHCYVCDIPVPCAHWSTGVSGVDHCHATEKEEFWRSQRKSFRLQKNAPLPVKVPDTSLSMPLPQLNLTPPRDMIGLSSNTIPQNQVSRPAVLRACSPSTRLTVPNMITQFRSRQSGPAFSRNRFPARSVPQHAQMLRVRNNVIRHPGVFKKSGIAGGAPEVNQYVYGSSNTTRGAYDAQCTRDYAPQETSNDKLHIHWVPSMNHDSFTYQSTPQTGLGNVFVSPVPSQSQVYGQPLSQPEAYSQPIAQQPIYSPPIPQPQIYSPPIPQPPVYTQHISQTKDGQNVNQLGNQRQNTTAPDFSEFDEWVSNNCQNNQQPQVDNCQLPTTGSIDEPLPIDDFNSGCNGSAKVQYNYTGYDNWFPDNQFVQASEGYVPPDLDDVNPDPAAFDAGWAFTLSEDLF
ncbi:RPM1 interacting protein 13 [Melia azedarach]|uniref:RPM1 interacting protein 13 n=1 Tax=Melia azedarach TaxID=155640 RepID=A0ACC1YY14_MELAZ|nr:RPM1 interacting protein 13 [Melia azedarach]